MANHELDKLEFLFFGLRSNENFLRNSDALTAFENFNAQEWVHEFRVETNGQLDIEATAAKVGIPVSYEMPVVNGEKLFVQGAITGVGHKKGIDPLMIHLDPEWNPAELGLTFGHELGHFFLQEEAGITQGRGGGDDAIETFCDFFGRQMALPPEKLAELNDITPATILENMAKFRVDHQTMIHQLMLAGKMSRRIIFDSGIGEVPNPYYSGKVRRNCICLDCEINAVHSGADIYDSPVYDFTSVELANTTSINECTVQYLRGNDLYIAVNKLYGRWTEADDAMTEEELRRSEKMRRVIFENYEE